MYTTEQPNVEMKFNARMMTRNEFLCIVISKWLPDPISRCFSQGFKALRFDIGGWDADFQNPEQLIG